MTNSLLALCFAVVSVADFGAIPNDGLDDSAAVQMAIEHSPDGTVEFPAGEWHLNNITIRRHGVTLRGEPGSRITKVDQGHPWMILLDRGYGDFSMHRLVIDGNEANQPVQYQACFRATLSDGVTITDCTFYRGQDRAVDMRGCTRVRLQNNRFVDCGITNPSGNGGNAISVDRDGDVFSQDVIVTGNYCRNFGDTAIGLPACEDVICANNLVIGNPDAEQSFDTESGISLNGSRNATCTGNLVRDCKAGGIFLWDRTGQPIQRVAVSGNVLINAKLTCRFMLADSHGITIVGNTGRDCMIGVMGDGGYGLVVSANTFSGTPNGLRMTGRGHKDHVVVGNIFQGPRPIEIQQFVQPGVVDNNIERNSE